MQHGHSKADTKIESNPKWLNRSPRTGRLRVGPDGDYLRRGNNRAVEPSEKNCESLLVNVYDLHWINGLTKKIRMAAYHSGLEVHGVEIAYGECGVYTMKPRDVESMESKMYFKKSVHIGYTNFSKDDAVLISKHLGSNVFTSASYDLLRQNCNHFSAALSSLLCSSQEIQFPSWINSLANVTTRLPLVERGIRHFTDAVDDEKDEGTEGCKKSRSGGLREVCANLSKASSSASSSSSRSSGCCSSGSGTNSLANANAGEI